MAKAAQLAERKALLADHIRAAYDSDRTSLIETILSADSFSDALADVGYLIDIGDQDKALAEQIGKDQQTLFALRQTVSQTRFDTDQLRAATAGQKKVLDKSLADLRRARASLKKLEKETARQLALQNKAYQAWLSTRPRHGRSWPPRPARTPRSIARSGPCWPTSSAAAASRPSTAARSPGRCRARSPRSSAAPASPGSRPTATAPISTRGSTSRPRSARRIRAAGPGRVLYAGPLSDGAWVVIIAHSTHLISLYGHVKRNIPVRAGQVVSQGQLIAYVGMTGHTTGPHLHWAVKLDDTWVNPRLFL